jgi:hypothetical protein
MRDFTRMEIKKKLSGLALFILFIGFAHSQALAVPISFNLGFGGTVSYGGVGTPFSTTNGVVTSVTNGSTTLGITGGDLDFSTGNIVTAVPQPDGDFISAFGAGGSLTIFGALPGGTSSLLMEGDFSSVSTFSCCSGLSSQFQGLLDITYIDPTLAAALGFVSPATGGSIAQIEILFGALPSGPGVAFSGLQVGGALAASDTAKVPEPTSFMLLAAGMVTLVFGVRKFSHADKQY